ncbi:putative Zinc knuckle-containing protein 8, partial [Homarus americanus]
MSLRKTCYKCGHEGHLANDKVDEVNIFNEEDFPATQLIGEIHSSKTDVREGEESVKVCQVPATTWFGVEKEEASAQTITQVAGSVVLNGVHLVPQGRNFNKGGELGSCKNNEWLAMDSNQIDELMNLQNDDRVKPIHASKNNCLKKQLMWLDPQ